MYTIILSFLISHADKILAYIEGIQLQDKISMNLIKEQGKTLSSAKADVLYGLG